MHLIEANPGLKSVIITRWRQPKIDAIHAKSLWFPKFIPMLFMVAWILIAVLSWNYPWLAPPAKMTASYSAIKSSAFTFTPTC
jgi:hypothetical protein